MTQPANTAARRLVETLVINGVDRVFCVPGESYLAVLDALADVRDRIEVIACRHEAGAANMAEAYGKLTGRPGATANRLPDNRAAISGRSVRGALRPVPALRFASAGMTSRYRLALSAPEVTASPAARTSRPMPETVLQAETARAAATSPRAMIFFMGGPLRR